MGRHSSGSNSSKNSKLLTELTILSHQTTFGSIMHGPTTGGGWHGNTVCHLQKILQLPCFTKSTKELHTRLLLRNGHGWLASHDEQRKSQTVRALTKAWDTLLLLPQQWIQKTRLYTVQRSLQMCFKSQESLYLHSTPCWIIMLGINQKLRSYSPYTEYDQLNMLGYWHTRSLEAMWTITFTKTKRGDTATQSALGSIFSVVLWLIFLLKFQQSTFNLSLLLFISSNQPFASLTFLDF